MANTSWVIFLFFLVQLSHAAFQKHPSYDTPVEIINPQSDEAKNVVRDAFNYVNTNIYPSKPRALVQILEIAKQNSNGIDYQIRLVLGTSQCPDGKTQFCGLGHIVDVDVVYMFRSSKNSTTEPRFRFLQLNHERCPAPIQHAGAFGQSMIPIPGFVVGPVPVSQKSAPESSAPGFAAVSKSNGALQEIFGNGPPGL
ncbi:unnamed protein product [Bursaphelenchus xylophilus]|uniref:(pine wood nematode) hypothetical protein n=1 Tax=Bursaphelenchus xylophilus TaxID=6326 RepID=A0A1I7RQN9_BURXY|nr:unnamed protein product [Bursaphelenchus xylophilus]CAG9104879.1 unnamed protein product [Bursaphelenchus xylophilus]